MVTMEEMERNMHDVVEPATELLVELTHEKALGTVGSCAVTNYCGGFVSGMWYAIAACEKDKAIDDINTMVQMILDGMILALRFEKGSIEEEEE